MRFNCLIIILIIGNNRLSICFSFLFWVQLYCLQSEWNFRVSQNQIWMRSFHFHMCNCVCVCAVPCGGLHIWLSMSAGAAIIEQHIGGNIKHFVDCHLFDNSVRCIVPSVDLRSHRKLISEMTIASFSFLPVRIPECTSAIRYKMSAIRFARMNDNGQ